MGSNIKHHKFKITQINRKKLHGHNVYLIWFTGLSGSEKSTIANLLEKKLSSSGFLTYLLDGDNLRHGLNKDLGFKKEDRIENLRRVGEVAKILYDSGMIVLASFISPYKKDRDNIRELFPSIDFIEVHVDAKIETVQSRDPKGLYKKANKGEIPNFTGISSDYEIPDNPEIRLDTDVLSAEESLNVVMEFLKEKNGI